jgi:hypothetical protein
MAALIGRSGILHPLNAGYIFAMPGWPGPAVVAPRASGALAREVVLKRRSQTGAANERASPWICRGVDFRKYPRPNDRFNEYPKNAQENVQENDQDDSAGDPQDNAEGSLQDNAVDDPPVVIDPQARAYASRCLAAAEAEGISSLEIQESIEDLAAFMAAAIQEANERGDPD